MTEVNRPDWDSALARARAESPFLARALDRQPELAELLGAGDAEKALEWVHLQGEGAKDVAVSLRRQRLALSTALGVGDLAGAFSLNRVMHELSDFADFALDCAIANAIRSRVDGAEPKGFSALALGKQGARELNYSSDIDPILLFDPDTLPRRDRDDPGEAAARYASHVVKALSETTADGFVFRVDLRLRPAAEVTPPAISFGAAQSHYQSSALAWERAAFIRARAASGDIAAGEQFLDRIRSFVWRTQLDFGAIEEIRRLTAQIRFNYTGPQRPGPGFDLKKGRGGIREIEFYAQTHQMIHGGRDPAVRVKGTRAALNALAKAGRIESEEAELLGQSYDRLRVIEHRLQMMHDRQTHSLPDGEALNAVARLDGLCDGVELVQELEGLTDAVGTVYDRLIGEETSSPVAVPDGSHFESWLEELGFAEPGKLAKRIDGWRDGRYQSLRSPQAIEAFDTVLPDLISAFADADDSERALIRWESLLERASSAINLFHFLAARPSHLRRLVNALSVAPTLADELGRRPELLDILIDSVAQEMPDGVDPIINRMESHAARDDYEAQLDCIRRVTGEMRFALGIQLVENLHDPLDIARALSRTAEAAVSVAAHSTAAEFAQSHGQIPGGELAIIGLGRLGGGVLTHASDLDMIYLFSGSFEAESDGPKPLGATLYFNRLAMRVSAALSVPTAQGALYEVDTRLRPQGNQGPLAVSIDAFGKYQREAAWTWEHMALARARVLVGSAAVRKQLDEIIGEVVCKSRDPRELRKNVLSMRGEMARHKLARGPLDVKLLRGGLVDIEFLVHYLQLRDGAGNRDIVDPDLGEALERLTEADLVSDALLVAHGLMTRILVAGRLLAPDGAMPPAAAANALAKACRASNMAELLHSLAVARQSVAKSWADVFEQELEID
ncbi:MAG: bifunctional [glutamate--ammonia ligase]-adenylyl-L-tyrosine phosphorylase/[glutamate--ammonia-ligase] adenylyltransferase [Pseudomonadota bacterium]